MEQQKADAPSKDEVVKPDQSREHENPNRYERDRGSSGYERGSSGFGRGGRFGGRGNRRGGDPKRLNKSEGNEEYQDEEYNDREPRFGRLRGMDDWFNERVQQISGPTFELPQISTSEKKFNGRNRLYIGNIGSEITEEDIQELFKPFGETSEIFLNKEKNFGFIKVDYHSNAQKAKQELDGTVLKSRNLKIRFAPNSATVKVKNLTPFVSNELLHLAFSVFGEIEKAIVCVDERGKSTGEGIVDFVKKRSAYEAIRKCSDGCYFLTSSLQPCIVEMYELGDDSDGYPEKNLPKKNVDYHNERQFGPRFAHNTSFEAEYGLRWKQLYDLFSQKQDALKKEFILEKEKLEAQMEYAKYEHETEMLKEQLRAREINKERQKREWEMKQRQLEDERVRAEEQLRMQQEKLESRILNQQQEIVRRQEENRLYLQAHSLDTMLNQQEKAYDQSSGYSNTAVSDNPLIEPKSFVSGYERDNQYESRDKVRSSDGNNSSNSRGHWIQENRRIDVSANKRRRF